LARRLRAPQLRGTRQATGGDRKKKDKALDETFKARKRHTTRPPAAPEKKAHDTSSVTSENENYAVACDVRKTQIIIIIIIYIK
jgi:hypothetical protein